MKEPLEEEFETPTQYEAAWHKWKNMKTHIIIPIKGIEERIKKQSEYPMTNQESIYELELILKGKQISLNEEDIEEKAKFYIKDNPDSTSLLLAYKQALIDILK